MRGEHAWRTIGFMRDRELLQSRRGIPVDMPLADLDHLASVLPVLEQLEVTTIGDLLECPPIRILARPDVGPGRGREWWELIGRALGFDPDVPTEPARRELPTVDELVATVVAQLTRDDRALVQARVFDGRTNRSYALELGVHPQATLSRFRRLLEDMRKEHSVVAREVTGDLTRALRKAGGILHADDVHRRVPAASLGAAWLAVLLAEDDRPIIWREEFLTYLTTRVLADRLARLRKMLGPAEQPTSWERINAAAHRVGFHLEESSLRRLLEVGLNRLVLDDPEGGATDEEAAHRRSLTRPQRLARILKLAGKPMHSMDIARAYFRGRARRAGTEEPAAITAANAGNLYPFLRPEHDIYCCGRAMYVHRSHLPVPLAHLERAVEWCVNRLRVEREYSGGAGRAMSASGGSGGSSQRASGSGRAATPCFA